MAKLYILGIGGTGARVLRSFTHLLIAGVKLGEDFDKVVPILIDPDLSNGDLNRTTELIRNYQEVFNRIKDTRPSGLFTQEILTLNQLNSEVKGQFRGNIQLDLSAIRNKSFQDFLSYNTLDDNQKVLIDLFFSSTDKNLQMDVGFKGNPNIGSIALNSLPESEAFKDFGASFSNGDSIFIINSIFGGTGAAGFPLLLKTLRALPNNFPNRDLIHNAPIGAITVLPYFKLEQDPNGIDSSTFLAKAKSALDFYRNDILPNGLLDHFYSLGDTEGPTYSNNPGGEQQENRAHFIEMASALSIVRYSRLRQTRRAFTEYWEFGVREIRQRQLTHSNLSDQDKEDLQGTLIRWSIFSSFWLNNNRRSESIKSPWTNFYNPRGLTQIDGEVQLNALCEDWLNLSNDISSNDVAFLTMKLKRETPFSQLLDDLGDLKPSSAKIKHFPSGHSLTQILNQATKQHKKLANSPDLVRLVSIWNSGMQVLLKKFNLN